MSEDDGKLDHILRDQLPWRRTEPKTECGREANDVASALSWEQAKAKFQRLGKQRAVMTSCMTCFNKVAYGHESWAERPTDVVIREGQGSRWAKEETLLDRELRALAALADAHREEFEGYLSGLEQTVNIAAAQRRKRGTR